MQMPGRGRTNTTRRRLVVAVVTAGLLAVAPAACGSPEPSPVSTSSKKPATKTPSPTPTPSTSPTPSASAGSVEEQLHAATIAFYTAVTKAYKTLDPAPIKTVIVPNSSAGGGYVNQIAEIKSKHHRYSRVPAFRVSRFAMEPQDADKQFETVTFTLMSKGSTVVDAGGKSVDENKPGSVQARIEFMRKGDQWLVLSQHFED